MSQPEWLGEHLHLACGTIDISLYIINTYVPLYNHISLAFYWLVKQEPLDERLLVKGKKYVDIVLFIIAII